MADCLMERFRRRLGNQVMGKGADAGVREWRSTGHRSEHDSRVLEEPSDTLDEVIAGQRNFRCDRLHHVGGWR
jgi:hypothetical protein